MLSRAGLAAAYGRLAREIGAPDPSESAAAAESFGIPPIPHGLPPTLKCRMEFAGYRKGDPAASTPAAMIPAVGVQLQTPNPNPSPLTHKSYTHTRSPKPLKPRIETLLHPTLP